MNAFEKSKKDGKLNQSELYREIQDDTIARIMKSILLLGFLGLIVSLSRYAEYGWMPIMSVHLFTYLTMCVLYILRRHVPYVLISSVIVVLLLLVTLAGYLSLGKASGGNFYGLFAVIMAVVLLGRNAGLIALGSIVLIQLISGIGFTQGLWSTNTELDAYNASLTAWITNIASLVFSGLIVVILLKQRSVIVDVIEQLREKTLEAESANQYKSAFLSTMSHELRTPLNGIIGLSNMLRDTELNPEQAKQVDLLCESGQHLVELLGNTLDMSKIESGRMELNKAPFDPALLVDTVVSSLGYMAQGTGTRLTVRSDLPVGAQYVGDSPKVRQVVYNLLGNAIKFTKDGQVEVVLREVEPAPGQGSSDSTVLVFAVKDTGEGIAADRLDSIFEPFSQINGQKTRVVAGTGLGLTITKQLVELMDGRIEVESVPNKGTVFTVCLPALRSAHKSAVEEVSDRSNEERLRVLIAEDNSVNALILKNMLGNMNCTVDHVENGRLAVEHALRDDVDIIFMDVHMPVLDGLQATEKIRRKYGADELPIIGATAGALGEEREVCVQAGMNDVLIKPFTRERLLSILSACTRRI